MSSSELAVRAAGLGKRYRLGGPAMESYRSIRESLADAARSALSRVIAGHHENGSEREIWALRDVSFQVGHGEVLGIIGRNGAGKTTLLKVLSRITEPTAGYVDVYGEVGSLLEVGTGFHPELTGRENVFLNGAILGMSRADILARFDDIVAFAELEQFLDTPVKRYSSGMYTRLAFAVAAHLQPDILVIDEVLAVGDIEFQRKCLRKMSEVAEHGRTVLFVSHNMQAVKEICSRCIWIDRGQIVADGSPDDVTRDYLSHGSVANRDGLIPLEAHNGWTGDLTFTKVQVLSPVDRQPTTQLLLGDGLTLRAEFEVPRALRGVRLITVVEALDGTTISVMHHPEGASSGGLSLAPGTHAIEVETEVHLAPGEYSLDLAAKPVPGYWGSGSTYDWVRRPVEFSVESVSRTGVLSLTPAGVVRPPARWSLNQIG